MQEQFKAALEFAHYQQTLSIKRKTLKERAHAKLTYGFNGGIFHIDQTLLTFVQMLCARQRTLDVVILDINDNPILVADLSSFSDEILSRYFEVTNEYFQQYEIIKKSRSVEKLLEQ